MLEVFFWPPRKLEEIHHMYQEQASTEKKCPARARLQQSSHERPHPIRRFAFLIRPKPSLRQ
jgi:hypothetical protein